MNQTHERMFILQDMTQPKTAKFRQLIMLASMSILAACTTPEPEPIPVEEPTPVVKQIEYSAAPIIRATPKDINYAQTALNKLGYKIGQVDGIWGPRSAAAIRAFELSQDIWSADGHLSELNLHRLAVASGIDRNTFGQPTIVKPSGISAKLKAGVALSAAPQLIIVDKKYQVLTKPNPYSSELMVLAPGTGIYVLSKQDGWFEVESIERQRGFIRID